MKFSSGLPETECGYGSTLVATERARLELPPLFRALGIRILFDAPCGDCNWVAETDLDGIAYIGWDNEPSHVIRAAAAMERSNALSVHVVVADVLGAPYPRADALLARDFYQHFPTVDVFAALRRFVDSGIHWLFATSHHSDENEDIPTAGMFRALDFSKAPFLFPAPAYSFPDPPGSQRILGAWPRQDVEKALAAAAAAS